MNKVPDCQYFSEYGRKPAQALSYLIFVTYDTKIRNLRKPLCYRKLRTNFFRNLSLRSLVKQTAANSYRKLRLR